MEDDLKKIKKIMKTTSNLFNPTRMTTSNKKWETTSKKQKRPQKKMKKLTQLERRPQKQI